MLFLVGLQHYHPHHVAHGYDLRGVADEPVAHLGDMHQAVLVDADVHEHAEIHHVADGARQHHAGGQVLNIQHIRS